MTDADLASSLHATRVELEHLTRRLAELERRTSIISPSFLKRAFAVYGHTLVAGLILMVPIWILMFVLFIVLGLAARMFGPH